MRGLLRNNFYTALPNVKVFTGIAVLLGAFVVAMDNAVPSLVIGYMLLVIVGFSLISIASVRKESAEKWEKYKLTTPVKRTDIVLSFFMSQLLWLFALLFTAIPLTGARMFLCYLWWEPGSAFLWGPFFSRCTFWEGRREAK